MDTIKRQRPVLTTLPGRRRRLGPSPRDALTIATAILVTFFACYGLVSFMETLASYWSHP